VVSVYVYSAKDHCPPQSKNSRGKGKLIKHYFELHKFSSTKHTRPSVNAVCVELHFAYQTEIGYKTPPPPNHNSSNHDHRITTVVGLQHNFCQKIPSTKKNRFYLYFRKNITFLNVGLSRICQIFFCPL
jgi:hypothetical protein